MEWGLQSLIRGVTNLKNCHRQVTHHNAPKKSIFTRKENFNYPKTNVYCYKSVFSPTVYLEKGVNQIDFSFIEKIFDIC